jgi:hypothetical protein
MESDGIQQLKIAISMLSDVSMLTQNTMFNLRTQLAEQKEKVAELREQMEARDNPVLVIEPEVQPEAPALRTQYVPNWALAPNGTRVKYCRNGFELFGTHLANGIIRGDDEAIHNALSAFARHEFDKLQDSGQLPPGSRPHSNAWTAVWFRDHDGWKQFHYIRSRA